MIAEDCEYLDKNFDDNANMFYYWCSAYQKEVGNCGDDCPKYECKNAEENIRKWKENSRHHAK